MALFQVNNFTGSLTRKSFGSMNSGLARVSKSHSLNPFERVTSLTFDELATNLDPSHATILDIIVDGDFNEESGTLYLYCVDRSGNVYKINTSTDAISVISNSLGITLHYGGGLRVIYPGGQQKLIISHDTGFTIMYTDGTGVSTSTATVTVQGAMGDVSTVTSQFNVSNTTESIDINTFNAFYTGMPVVYTAAIGSVTPLVNGTTYYLIVLSPYQVQVALSLANAQKGVFIPITAVSNPALWVFSGSVWMQNVPHPMAGEYFGAILIGNGFNLFDYAISSGTVKYSRLNPTFPQNYTINSLEVDGQGRYVRINGTTGTSQDIITVDPTAPAQTPIARSVYWNGIDDSYDSYDAFTQTNTSALSSFLGADMAFGNDFYGNAVFQNNAGSPDKMLSLRSIRAPLPGSITASSNFLLFGAPYYVNGWLTGIFGMGKLDDEDQGGGVYQLLGIPPTSNNTICTAVGMVKLVQNRTVKSDGTYLTQSKLYVSSYETGGTPAGNLYSLSITPNAGTPSLGIYETQKEKFQVMQQIDRILFYMNPTSAGVSFKLELVDVDDTIPTGGSFTYTYASGTDETLLQGSLEQFEWSNLNVKNFQALGLRITNLGTVQPGLNAIVIETHSTDKAATDQNT